MLLSRNPIQYWQNHRKRTIERLFTKCPDNLFGTGLELGADYGFQSVLLTRYISKLVSTEIKPSILQIKGNESVTYCLCDAENDTDSLFGPQRFDFVFSSNLLEHLHDPCAALKRIRRVLRDGGITVNLMPSPLFVILHIAFHFPCRLVTRLKRPRDRAENDGDDRREYALAVAEWHQRQGTLKDLNEFVAGFLHETSAPFVRQQDQLWNTVFRRIRCLLLPRPHGTSTNLIEEMTVFSQSAWEKRFKAAGLRVVGIIKAPMPPALSGLHIERVSAILEKLGCATEYAYIAVKTGQTSPYAAYF